MSRIAVPASVDDAPAASRLLLEAVQKRMHAALNVWTNSLNEVARTDIDFPVVAASRAA